MPPAEGVTPATRLQFPRTARRALRPATIGRGGPDYFRQDSICRPICSFEIVLPTSESAIPRSTTAPNASSRRMSSYELSSGCSSMMRISSAFASPLQQSLGRRHDSLPTLVLDSKTVVAAVVTHSHRIGEVLNLGLRPDEGSQLRWHGLQEVSQADQAPGAGACVEHAGDDLLRYIACKRQDGVSLGRNLNAREGKNPLEQRSRLGATGSVHASQGREIIGVSAGGESLDGDVGELLGWKLTERPSRGVAVPVHVLGRTRPHLLGGAGEGMGVREYMPTGCPTGSVTSPTAPPPSDRLNGNPGGTVPPSSFALAQLAWMSVT